MSENAVIEWVVALLVMVGTGITLISSLGVIRLPDVYTRAHATTKSATLGILFILLGAFVYFVYVHQIVSVRLLLGIVFVFLTAPVAGHLIIRSAHRSGVPLANISVRDDLKDYLESVREETRAKGGGGGSRDERGGEPTDAGAGKFADARSGNRGDAPA